MKVFLEKLSNKQNLTFEESKSAFEILMNGKTPEGMKLLKNFLNY